MKKVLLYTNPNITGYIPLSTETEKDAWKAEDLRVGKEGVIMAADVTSGMNEDGSYDGWESLTLYVPYFDGNLIWSKEHGQFTLVR